MSRIFDQLVGVAATTLLAIAFLPLAATTASAGAAGGTSNNPSRIGLYGQQSPRYDGVYRQGLSIIALESSGADVDRSATRWLRRQQCRSGSWMSFRPDLDQRCGAADSNATAMAVMALNAVGSTSPATDGLKWLVAHQLDGGGWEYTKGWGADSNSTGLVVQALIAMKVKPNKVRNNGSPADFLSSLQLGCEQPDVDQRGALDYQAQVPLVRNDFATAQATQALAGSPLPVASNGDLARLPRIDCAARTTALTMSPSHAAASYLGRRLQANNGTIPSAFGGGVDWGSTANAVLSLVATGFGPHKVEDAMVRLERSARSFTEDAAGSVLPAAAALLTLAENATGGEPRDVDGLNLIKRLKRSITEPTGAQ